jgi:hypothetical protein
MKTMALKSTNGSTISHSRTKSRKGIALAAAVICILILTILGFSVLFVASNEITLTKHDINRTKAFYLAEAGVEVLGANLSKGIYSSIDATQFGAGTYQVDFNSTADPPFAVAIGTVGGQQRRIRVNAGFLAPPYENGIYAGGLAGINWALSLRGKNNPTIVKDAWNNPIGNVGGKDKINGNIFVDGDVYLYEQSRVDPPVGVNPFDLHGDVTSTGDVNVDSMAGAAVAGTITENADPLYPPNMLAMNYPVNNTYNVSQHFQGKTLTYEGYLPSGDPLRNVFAKNPGNMSSECGSTPGDDYFLTPSTGFSGGSWNTAPTPLDIGDGQVYYIDGDLWIHSKSTYGFKISGNSTIVVTGNIHLCDNTVYADPNVDMMGLVALGKYDPCTSELESGGNIYYGDPTTGTLYVCSSMMFAADSFYYNCMGVDSYSGEPESGFIVNGNISALNKVAIERDWYTKYEYQYVHVGMSWVWKWVQTGVHPASYRYNSVSHQWEWVDTVTGVALTAAEINGDASTSRKAMRHYQMVVNYDDRVRSRDTQPPGLPRGVGTIFEGFTDWEELP